MAKVTIVPEDNKVYVEGVALDVDIDLPAFIHAIQWDGSQGEIEFKPDKFGKRMSNVKIIDFNPYEYLVQRWKARKDEIELAALREKKATEDRIKKIQEEEEEQRSRRPM
jgi:hypothetical protein